MVPLKDSNGLVTSIVAFLLEKISEEEKKSVNKTASEYIEKLFIPKKYFLVNAYYK